jgi:hypothetical protein
MLPKLLPLMKNGAEGVSLEAGLLVSHLTYYIPHNEKKMKVIE